MNVEACFDPFGNRKIAFRRARAVRLDLASGSFAEAWEGPVRENLIIVRASESRRSAGTKFACNSTSEGRGWVEARAEPQAAKKEQEEQGEQKGEELRKEEREAREDREERGWERPEGLLATVPVLNGGVRAGGSFLPKLRTSLPSRK